jgi:ABC-type polysaccharide/polyol phosphate transport system ATPase subunit
LKSFVELEGVGLTYRLYRERERTLKAAVLGVFSRRSAEADSTRLEALHDLTVRIEPGEVVGVIGANGAGKSSLMRVIAHIYRPTVGTVRTCGTLVPLFQVGLGFHPDLSGRANIYQAGAYLRLGRRQMDEHVPEILSFAGLDDYANVPIKYYSAGMRMRLAFTTATAIPGDILLLDEVLTAGDASFRERALERMESLITQTPITVIVSHAMPVIQRICSRVLWIHRGRIACDGSPDESIGAYSSWLSRDDGEPS